MALPGVLEGVDGAGTGGAGGASAAGCGLLGTIGATGGVDTAGAAAAAETVLASGSMVTTISEPLRKTVTVNGPLGELYSKSTECSCGSRRTSARIPWTCWRRH